jgi:predicted RNA-binding Zn ribbon-like protein
MSEQTKIDLPDFAFDFTGGHVSLDFVNTADGRADIVLPKETLKDYRYLLLWGVQARMITEEEAGVLLEEARRHPEEAADVFRRAVAFREVLYRLTTLHIHNEQPDVDDLAIFNAMLAATRGYERIVDAGQGRFQWSWDEQSLPLDRMLWEVTRQAGDLLTSGDLQAVKTCGNADCDWVFIDTSKNHSRRWCDMKTCGNRVKVRRHYQRQKQNVQ